MQHSIGASYYTGKTLFVTGATGLVGKVLLETLLRKLPNTKRTYVMIRARKDRAGNPLTAAEVLQKEVIDSTAFDFLRERHGSGFASFVAERVQAVEGDLSKDGLAMAPETYAMLSSEVDVVISSAALAVFDAPLDSALETNTLGPQRILKFAREAAKRPFVAHISTCYVSNVAGPVFESVLDPGWTPGGVAPGETFDVSEEVAAITAEIGRIRQSGGKNAMVTEGLRWARRRGWKDTYTFTKAMGEQLFIRHLGDVEALILRPSIIESSLQSPAPGWIDGFRMMDPLIVGYARGQLVEFPGNPEAVLDVVPADTVVNALLMAIPWTHCGKGARVYQVASGMDKPLLLKGLRDYMVEYFKNAPLRRVEVKEAPKLPHLTFPEVTGFLRRVDWYLRPLRVLEKLHVPLKRTPWGKKRHAALSARRNRVQWLRNTAAIYGPYAANQARFLTFNLRPMWDALGVEDRKQFPCLLHDLDWKSYFHDVHLPGIERYLLRMPRRKTEVGAPLDILAHKQTNTLDTINFAAGREDEQQVVKLAKAEKVLVLTRLVRPVDAQAWTAPTYKRAIHRASNSLVRRICKRRLKLECDGSENIPERGPFILVANHTSHVDTGVLMTAVGPLAAQIHPTAAADYWFRSRFLAWLLQATLGAIPFDRKCRNIPKAVALPAQILRNGHSLIFYPEGSRSQDGQLQSFRSTLGLIALASGAPILPAFISGACEALPKGESFINAHPVRVRFGKIIPAESYLAMLDGDSVSSVSHKIAKDVHEAVQALQGKSIAAGAARREAPELLEAGHQA